MDEVKGCESKTPLCLLAAKPHVLFFLFYDLFLSPPHIVFRSPSTSNLISKVQLSESLSFSFSCYYFSLLTTLDY